MRTQIITKIIASSIVVLSMFVEPVVSQLPHQTMARPATTDSGTKHKFALARIIGSEMVIVAPDTVSYRRRLDFEFLIWSFTSDGMAIAGWGRPRLQDLSLGFQVILTDSYGRSPAKMIPGLINVRAISISPDRRFVAVVATNRAISFTGLQIIDLSAGEPAGSARAVEAGGEELGTYLAWGPENDALLYSVRGDVKSFDVKTGRSVVFAHGSMPTWSPDGRWKARVTGHKSLLLVDGATGRQQTVRSSRGFHSGAMWSPDSMRFLVDEEWSPDPIAKKCFSSSRLVSYSIKDLSKQTVMDPCGVKPQFFGWIDDWQQWTER
jgi:hypothetical protein